MKAHEGDDILLDPDRIITQDDAKLVEKTSVVAILDRRFTLVDDSSFSELPKVDYSQADLVVNNPVPVVNEDGDEIGTVTLFIDKTRAITGEFFLNANTPEVFDINNRVRQYYPHFVGSTRAVMPQIGDLGIEKVTDFKVTAVYLLDDPPMDTRVKPLP